MGSAVSHIDTFTQQWGPLLIDQFIPFPSATTTTEEAVGKTSVALLMIFHMIHHSLSASILPSAYPWDALRAAQGAPPPHPPPSFEIKKPTTRGERTWQRRPARRGSCEIHTHLRFYFWENQIRM